MKPVLAGSWQCPCCRWCSFLLPWDEGGEAHRRTGLCCSPVIRVDHGSSATRFSAAASQLSRWLHLFNLLEVLFFLQTPLTCPGRAPCSCEHEPCCLLKRRAVEGKEWEHSSVITGMICAHTVLYIILFMLYKSQAEALSRLSEVTWQRSFLSPLTLPF